MPETCLPGDLPTKGPAHQEPAIQEPGTQESVAQRPAHQESARQKPAQTLPPVCCSAPSCDYSTPVGANAGTALKFLKIHVDVANRQQETQPATAAGQSLESTTPEDPEEELPTRANKAMRKAK